jgi:serine kinase of HPr protein (carbohydrate metabolism regulator)
VIAHQATCVAIGGRGVLIEGAPGSGKSSLALALIDRGAVLVGDDGVMLEAHGGTLIVRPHPRTRGMLEVRNLGVLDFAVRDDVAISLAVTLDAAAPRFIEDAGTRVLCGASVPHVLLTPRDPLLTVKTELALSSFGTPDTPLPFAGD